MMIRLRQNDASLFGICRSPILVGFSPPSRTGEWLVAEDEGDGGIYLRDCSMERKVRVPIHQIKVSAETRPEIWFLDLHL
jgi:hypothetical protein